MQAGQFRKGIAKALEKALSGKMKSDEIEALLEKPRSASLGDIAFPCFKLAAMLKKQPQQIAKDLAQGIGLPDGIERAEATGAYLNFFFSEAALAGAALKEVLEQKGKYGLGNAGKEKRVMVEYSSPNTNKPLHIGHLRNDSLGMCISNLLEANGFKVIRANLLSDRGIHICKAMVAYEKWAERETPSVAQKKGDKFVGDLYIKFEREAAENPMLQEQANEMLRKWEAGDKKTRALWQKMDKWVVESFRQTYKEFGSRFDVWFRESEFYNKTGEIIQQGISKGVFAKNDGGATVAVLEPHGISNKTILRADGTAIYITNDLALTKHKFEKYKLDEAIWVVASEQNLYFKQLFKIFDLLGYGWSKKCSHLSYGMVFLPEGRLKSREGRVVEADDLIAEVKALAEQEVRVRYKDISDKEVKKRSDAIALCAIKFFLLKMDATKDMVFDARQAVSFEGETGPYVMYSYARAKSILQKAGLSEAELKKAGAGGKAPKASADFSALKEPAEKHVVSLIARYPETVQYVLRTLSPHTLCQYLLELSATFNTFYQSIPVLKAEGSVRAARLALVAASAQVLKNGLALLNIEALERM